MQARYFKNMIILLGMVLNIEIVCVGCFYLI